MRREALPLAYRETAFRLDDMVDVLKLLIAIGKTGRDNIESLEFPWWSQADTECKWDEAPTFEDHNLTLPALHVERCVRLLGQCKRLRFLRLHFESDLMQQISLGAFRSDPGIRELCSTCRVESLEIWSMGNESLDDNHLAKWMRTKMEGSCREGGRD